MFPLFGKGRAFSRRAAALRGDAHEIAFASDQRIARGVAWFALGRVRDDERRRHANSGRLMARRARRAMAGTDVAGLAERKRSSTGSTAREKGGARIRRAFARTAARI